MYVRQGGIKQWSVPLVEVEALESHYLETPHLGFENLRIVKIKYFCWQLIAPICHLCWVHIPLKFGGNKFLWNIGIS
jgi:hypothetical protein